MERKRTSSSVAEDGSWLEISEKAAMEKIKRALREPKLKLPPHDVIEGTTATTSSDGNEGNSNPGEPSSCLSSVLPLSMVPETSSSALDARMQLFGRNLMSSFRAENGGSGEQEQIEEETQEEQGEDVSEFLLDSMAISNKPTLTMQHVDMELAALTDEEQSAMLADVFGRMCSVRPRRKRPKCDLDPESIDFLVRQMKLELENIPDNEKCALSEAKAKCSRQQEFSDERLRQFLRCEGMNVKLAARRFVNYWAARRQVFGDDKFLLAMTLKEALREDLPAIGASVYCLLPHADKSGRPLLFARPSCHTREGYTSESLLRAAWYVAEVSVQENQDVGGGVVRMLWAKDFSIFDYDDVFDSVVRLESSCWSLRLNAIHVCCPSSAVLRFLLPLITAVKNRSTRVRTLVHDVPESQIADTLEQYGITKQMLPQVMNGDVELNPREWIAQRRAIEMEEL